MTKFSKIYIRINFKKFFKATALIMAIAMFLSALPLQTIAMIIPKDTESYYLNGNSNIKNTKVLYELEDYRDKYTKVFIKEDRTLEKEVYDEAVHYLKDGKWNNVNNTLIDTNDEYENKDNYFKIKLPKSLTENKKFKLKYDDYEINWQINDINKTAIDVKDKQNIKVSDIRELINVNQEVNYSNILNDTDIQYIIKSESIKENIILKSYQSDFNLSFTYDLKNLDINYDENGNVIFTNDGKTVFSLGNLYMIDANGEISNDVNVNVTQLKDNSYKITIIPDDNWLADESRLYPVKIDPSIDISNDRDATTSPIKDKYVLLGEDSYYDNEQLRVSNDHIDKTHISFMELKISSILNYSTMTYAILKLNKNVNYNGDSKIKLYGVDTNYDKITGLDLPSYTENHRVFDEINIKDQDTDYYFDITKLVQKWELDSNIYGTIALKNSVANTSTLFNSSEYHSFSIRPTLSVGYIEPSGLKDYYTYHSQDVEFAGTAYVNDYSGYLSYVYNDYSLSTERSNLFSFSHIYNDINSDENIGYGNGWRLSLGEEIVHYDYNDYYYQFEGDGTKTYYNNNVNYYCTNLLGSSYGSYSCRKAEDGSGRILAGYKLDREIIEIHDKSSIIKYYKLDPNFEPYERYYLYKYEDKDTGDEININYISKTINCNYNNVVTSITDSVGNIANFSYNDTTGLLKNITIQKKNESGTLETVEKLTYGYTNGNLTSVLHEYDYNKDGTFTPHTATFNYSYDDVNKQYLFTVNSDTDQGVSYIANQNRQVINIKDNNTNAYIDVSYYYKKTIFKDYKDNLVQYLFDDYGHTINLLDNKGYSIYYKYEDIYNATNAGNLYFNYNLNHKINYKSKPQIYKYNEIYNHSFEIENPSVDGWYLRVFDAIGSANRVYGGYYGNYATNLHRRTGGGSIQYRQDIKLNKGSYTLSGYIKNEDIDPNRGASLGVIEEDNNVTITSGESDSQIYNSSGEYKYFEISFEVKVDNTDVVIYLESKTADAYFDNIQLVDSYINSRYNLIQNSSFDSTDNSWNLNGQSIIDITKSDDYETDIYDKILGNKNLWIKGGETARIVSQDLSLSLLAGTSIVFGGYAKAYSLPSKYDNTNEEFLNDRKFQIRVTGTDSSGKPVNYVMEFNHDIEDWQYLMETFTLDKDVYNIKIEIVYQGANSAYFDGIQFYVDSFGSQYKYNKDGNLETVLTENGEEVNYTYVDSDFEIERNKIKGASSSNNSSNVEYNEDGTIYSVNDKNAKQTFTYNSNNQVESIKVGNDSKYFTAKISYDYNKQYIDTTTDEFGNVVDYNYDVVTGLLNELFDEKGNKTSYSYDDLGNLLEVIKAKKNTDGTYTDVKSTYKYDTEGRIDKIYINNFFYDFDYDSHDRLVEVKVGNISLMKYSYLQDTDGLGTIIETDLIDTQTYGNQDVIKFEYDDEDRVTAIKFKKPGVTYTGDNVDSEGYLIKYQYKYNGDGNIAKVIDNIINKTYYYNYDLQGRVTKVVDEVGNELIYSYDKKTGDFTGFKYNINDVSREINYETDNNTGLPLASEYYLSDGTHVRRTNHYNPNNNYDASIQAYRQLDKITTNIGLKSYDTTYQYENPNTAGSNTSTRIKGINIMYGGYTLKMVDYTYDERGNIISIAEYGDKDIGHENYYSYEYDELNQLTKETLDLIDHSGEYKHVVIDYDYYSNGNIKHKTEDINGHIKDYYYDEYNSTVGWNDQLTGVEIRDNDNPGSMQYYSITYDNSGNPIVYDNFTFEYEGRQLVKATNNQTGDVIEYKYNDSGYRTQKIVHNDSGDVTTNYYLSGDKVVYEQTGSDVIYYTYDANGKIISFNYNGNEYFYIRNLQGDIVGIHDKDINVLVKYSYDAYGNILNINDNSGINLGQINKYRYRGYRYDEETNFYYLNSRYYDSNIGRFINADGQVGETGDLLGHNMYAYCQNNPVMRVDPSGYLPKWAETLIIATTVVAVVAVAAAITVATAGTGTMAAAIAIGALKGAAFGYASGAALGAVSGYIATGTLDGALNGMADGALTGAITGAISGGIAGGVKYSNAAKAWYGGKSEMIEHFTKHGKGMGFKNPVDYTNAARNVINNGKYIAQRNAYAILEHGRKYSYVGVNRGGSLITTFSYRTISNAKAILYGLL